MVASIDRNRWRSWAIQWTSRPRRVLRKGGKACLSLVRTLRRRLIATVRLLWAGTRRVGRLTRSTSDAVVRRSRAAVYRARRGNTHAD
jgi:hypothetical protein